MGNAGSGSTRDRHKSGEAVPISPREGHVFTFDKKPNKLVYQTSGEEEDEFGAHKHGLELKNTLGTSEGGLSSSHSSCQEVLADDQPSKLLPTVFRWEGGGKQVYISGTFSNWRPIPMVKSHGDFVTIVDLPEGDHQYKFYVDGEWVHDPTEPTADNGVGSKNNIIKVQKSDFEVFDALEIDSVASASNQCQGSPPGDYSQEIPVFRTQEKAATPPILPPHLLQVILNKDTPLSCEPTLLPEPNHVMLNHLYALSIKDGVMVLSATHRYRKKYVTTLLYKPI